MEDRLTFGWVYRKWYQQLYFNEINEVPLDGKHFIMCLWLFFMMCNMWNCSRVKCDSVYRFSIHSQSILKISIQHFHVRPPDFSPKYHFPTTFRWGNSPTALWTTNIDWVCVCVCSKCNLHQTTKTCSTRNLSTHHLQSETHQTNTGSIHLPLFFHLDHSNIRYFNIKVQFHCIDPEFPGFGVLKAVIIHVLFNAWYLQNTHTHTFNELWI